MRFILHVWSWPHVVFRLVGHARVESRFSRVELYPLIQFHLVSEMVKERVVSSEVRLSELDTRFSSSDNLVGMEVDMVMSKTSTSSLCKPFQALIVECVLEGKHLKNFRKCFQLPTKMKIHLPHLGEKASAFAHDHVCFYEADFLCGLRFPMHPFIHKLLDHFKIATG